MNTLSQERMEEMEATKEVVKTMNVNAVADLLIKVQEDHHKVLADNVDLRRMVTTNNQQMIEMRAELNMLKAMGFRGNLGTGSTVHNANE